MWQNVTFLLERAVSTYFDSSGGGCQCRRKLHCGVCDHAELTAWDPCGLCVHITPTPQHKNTSPRFIKNKKLWPLGWSSPKISDFPGDEPCFAFCVPSSPSAPASLPHLSAPAPAKSAHLSAAVCTTKSQRCFFYHGKYHLPVPSPGTFDTQKRYTSK